MHPCIEQPILVEHQIDVGFAILCIHSVHQKQQRQKISRRLQPATTPPLMPPPLMLLMEKLVGALKMKSPTARSQAGGFSIPSARSTDDPVHKQQNKQRHRRKQTSVPLLYPFLFKQYLRCAMMPITIRRIYTLWLLSMVAGTSLAQDILVTEIFSCEEMVATHRLEGTCCSLSDTANGGCQLTVLNGICQPSGPVWFNTIINDDPGLCPADDFVFSLSSGPSTSPSVSPTSMPSAGPSSRPTASPSTAPSTTPSSVPSSGPSVAPSLRPSVAPSVFPSLLPSTSPS